MANFKAVNKAVKKHTDLDVDVVRGEGYVYFTGSDGEEMDSIMTHPTTTSTDDLIHMVLMEIEYCFYGRQA